MFRASKTALPEKIMMPVLLAQGDRQVLPAHEVAADGVAPAHVAPAVPLGVVLVEQVILAVEEDQPVGVVDEVLRGREVEQRPPSASGSSAGEGERGREAQTPRARGIRIAPDASWPSPGPESVIRCPAPSGSLRGARPWSRA